MPSSLNLQPYFDHDEVISLAAFKRRVDDAIADGDRPMFQKLMSEWVIDDRQAKRVCHSWKVTQGSEANGHKS